MGKNLAKYNACTHPQTARELDALPGQKEINPTFVGLISFWNPATSYSPGRFPSRSLPPLAARDRKPNQVQCCTWLKTAREEKCRRAKKKPSHKAELFLWNPATSYSPGRFPSRSLPPGNSHSRVPWPLLAIPDAPPACFRHWRRQAPVPLGAHGEKPSQVQCRTHPEMAREQLSPGRFSPCCIDPGNSHSRGPLAAPCDSRRSACLFPPLVAAGSGPTERARLET